MYWCTQLKKELYINEDESVILDIAQSDKFDRLMVDKGFWLIHFDVVSS